jgi:hypothetical protein
MSVKHESGDQRKPYLQCDEPGCRNRLRTTQKGNFRLGADLTPLPATRWVSVSRDGDRRDYCGEHAAAASP